MAHHEQHLLLRWFTGRPAGEGRILAGLLALATMAGAATAAVPVPAPATLPWVQPGSDLVADPSLHCGWLANGVRFVVMPNHEPRGRVSLRLLVLAGSWQENEDQRGLAHFLEHMAFRGTRRYAAGSLVEYFQRTGMNFGGDTNASTAMDSTVYKVELPDAQTSTVAEGLRVLADYAGGLLLEPEAIEKERGVVLSEWNIRNTVDARAMLTRVEATLGSTRVPWRMPLGVPEVISRASRAQLLDFWNTWYRPERLVVLAVGEVNPGEAERMITAEFSGLVARAPARPDPAVGPVERFRGVRPVFHRDPEAGAPRITLSTVLPCNRAPDTQQRRRERLRRQLAFAMLNSRLGGLARLTRAPVTQAEATYLERPGFYAEASVDLTCRVDQWWASLLLGEQQLRGALKFGFQPVELQMAVAATNKALEQAAAGAATRRSPTLAAALAQSILRGEVPLDPRAEAALLRPELARITVDDCTAALRDAFEANGRYVTMTGNLQATGDAKAVLDAVLKASETVELRPRRTVAVGPWAYGDFGRAGTVVQRREVADLGLTLVQFANGVCLNLKETPFEAGKIRLRVRLAGGATGEPRDKPGLASLATDTFIEAGLKKHSFSEYSQILAGRSVELDFTALIPDACEFTGATAPEDLDTELQLLTAQIASPGFRPEALMRERNNLVARYSELAHSPDGPLSTEVARVLATGDPRFGLPALGTMLARNLNEVRDWLRPQLEHNAIEIALVGDLDKETAIAAVAKTLGALPRRDPWPPASAVRGVRFPPHPFTLRYDISSATAEGRAMVYWPTTDGFDAGRDRRLGLLASVLRECLRERVRESLGLSYSPEAESRTSRIFPEYGYMEAAIAGNPAQVAQIADIAVALGAALARDGVTKDQLDRARRPALTAAREALCSNGYWLNEVLACAQAKPIVLEQARAMLSDLENCRPADLSELAATYLVPARASRVTLLPGGPSASEVAASSAPRAGRP